MKKSTIENIGIFLILTGIPVFLLSMLIYRVTNMADVSIGINELMSYVFVLPWWAALLIMLVLTEIIILYFVKFGDNDELDFCKICETKMICFLASLGMVTILALLFKTIRMVCTRWAFVKEFIWKVLLAVWCIIPMFLIVIGIIVLFLLLVKLNQWILNKKIKRERK